MERNDSWKEYFDRNREEFEEDLPNVEAGWEALAGKLPGTAAQPSKPSPVLRYWMAATVLLGALCIGLLADRWQAGGSQEVLLGVEQSQVNDFGGTVAQFTQLIAERKGHLAHYAGQQGSPLESFQVDLAQLAAQYDELQLTLEDTQDPRVLRAMIFNLELQLQLLDDQLQTLEATQPDATPDVEI